MVNWEEWNDEKLKADQRYKLIFIRRFGEEESEFMEKGVFGRKGIETLTSRYIPVKVDVDERPDVFVRYGFGTTPSVSITTQDGRTLGGGTLCDYESFIKFMIELGTLITREKEIIEKYGAEELEEDEEPENDIDISEIRLQDLAQNVAKRVVEAKIPSTKLLLEILSMWIKIGNETEARKTLNLLEMAEDKVEGGIFSGSSYENPLKFSTFKSSDENVRYALELKRFGEKFNDKAIQEKAEKQLDFSKTFFNGEYFINLIGEDQEYYKSTKSIREIRQKPPKDERLFSGKNLEIAEMLIDLGELDLAQKVVNKVSESLISGKKVFHSEKKNVENMTADLTQALITFSKMKNYPEEKIKELEEILYSKRGKNLFFDYKENGFGALKKRKIDILGNIKAAKFFKFQGKEKEANEIIKSLLPKILEKNPTYIIYIYSLLLQ